jgi:nucleoside diphosphate kinase
MRLNSVAEAFPLELTLEKEKEGGNFSVVLLKPGFDDQVVSEFQEFLHSRRLRVMYRKRRKLNKSHVIALYPKVFRYQSNDLIYGLGWKEQFIKYLTSSSCMIYFIEGENAIRILQDFKFRLRKKKKLILHPKKQGKMDEGVFFEKVIKNLIHVVDRNDIQNSLWLLQ